MSFTLTTSGVLGADQIIANLTAAQYNKVTTLVDFLDPDREAYDCILDLLASAGSRGKAILHLTPPWPTEDLKAHSLDGSELFRHARTRIDQLCRYLASNEPRWPDREDAGYPLEVVGYEYGLAFVPMQDHYREEIRRMAELQALFARAAHTYRIAFPGGAYAYVKRPLPPGLPTDEQLVILEELYNDSRIGKFDRRVADLVTAYRTVRDLAQRG